MKYFLRNFLLSFFILCIFTTICCARENSIFDKRLSILQHLVKQLESYKPKIVSLPMTDNSNSGRIAVDYSERVEFVEKTHKKWEQLIADFKNDFNSYKNSNLSDDLLFCISSIYTILSQFSHKYYEETKIEVNTLLKNHASIYLEPTTVKILSNTNTFSWLRSKNNLQNIKAQMAKSLIFLYLKYENPEIAKKEAKLMEDSSIFSKQEYLEIENYIESYSTVTIK